MAFTAEYEHGPVEYAIVWPSFIENFYVGITMTKVGRGLSAPSFVGQQLVEKVLDRLIC